MRWKTLKLGSCHPPDCDNEFVVFIQIVFPRGDCFQLSPASPSQGFIPGVREHGCIFSVFTELSIQVSCILNFHTQIWAMSKEYMYKMHVWERCVPNNHQIHPWFGFETRVQCQWWMGRGESWGWGRPKCGEHFRSSRDGEWTEEGGEGWPCNYILADGHFSTNSNVKGRGAHCTWREILKTENSVEESL